MGALRGSRRSIVVLVLMASAVVLPLFLRSAQVAHADASVSIMYGFVSPDSGGVFPTKVRALGESTDGSDAPVCGTADVIDSGAGTRFYVVNVLSAAAHPGCPSAGENVRFLLLYGAVDPGTVATQVATWSTTPQEVDLSPNESGPIDGAFVGTLPTGSGYALLIWTGPDNTPIRDAVATIPRGVFVVYRLGASSVQRYLPDAAASLSDLTHLNHGDIVAVLLR